MTNKLLFTAATVSALTLIGGATAAATATASPAKITATHLTAYTTDDGPSEQIILTGGVGDYGPAVSVNPDGSTNPEHNSQLELRLQRGTFRLDIASIDKAFITAVGHQFPTDQATCSGTVSLTQRVPIVNGSGTGAYKKAAGDFALTITLDEVDQPTAGQPCDGTQPFLSQTIVTTGSGNVRF